MSVIATTSVSIRPSPTIASSSRRRGCLAWPWSSLLIADLLRLDRSWGLVTRRGGRPPSPPGIARRRPLLAWLADLRFRLDRNPADRPNPPHLHRTLPQEDSRDGRQTRRV